MQGEPIDILLVEDNESHAELVIENLKDHKMANNIHHASDGREALDYLLREGKYTDAVTSPRPHLIMLDLRLPKVDGLDVLRQVKENESLAEIPVVVLTSSDADADIKRAYDLNANSYLIKPVKFDAFCELLSTLGFYWLAWNRLPSGVA